MKFDFLKKKLSVGVLFILTASSLALSIAALMESSKISQYYDSLFIINFTCVALLIGLILKEIRALLKKQIISCRDQELLLKLFLHS